MNSTNPYMDRNEPTNTYKKKLREKSMEKETRTDMKNYALPREL